MTETFTEETEKSTELSGKVQKLLDSRGKKFHRLDINVDDELGHLLHVIGYDNQGNSYYVGFVDKREC